MFKLENLIVNPAGSQGARFLMTSVAIDVPSDKVEAHLREHEAEVRDAVMSALESETLDMLTRPGARDSIKDRIARIVVPLAGDPDIHIFLPQYVIQ